MVIVGQVDIFVRVGWVGGPWWQGSVPAVW
jgi:hypothetical protein